jgi:hypothetical protein
MRLSSKEEGMAYDGSRCLTIDEIIVFVYDGPNSGDPAADARERELMNQHFDSCEKCNQIGEEQNDLRHESEPPDPLDWYF